MTAPVGIAAPKRRLIPLWLRIAVTVVVVAATVWFLVIPQFGDAEESFSALNALSPWLLSLAFLFEGMSLLSFSALSRTILGKHRLPYWTSLRIDLADLAANFTLPGGGATASALRYRLLRLERVKPRIAISAATVEVTVENLALFFVFAVGIALSIAQLGTDTRNYLVAGITALVLLLAIAALIWVLVRRTDWASARAAAIGRRIRFIGAERASGLVLAFADTLRQLGQDRRRLVGAAAFALGNWILDAASLWTMLAAFGHPMPVGPLLAVYGVGTIIALLPITPGGVGLVEGVMVPALIGFGVPHGAALLGVIGWRVFEYWLPIPLGGAAYLSLKFSRKRRLKAADRAVAPEPPLPARTL
jgi:uncharacterized protein (TIRG00374 family)